MKRGTFLVIDGTDGSGKKTQTEKLILRMKVEGYPVATFAFPRYETPTGREVKRYLNGEFGPAVAMDPYRASEYYADDRKAAAAEIEGLLAKGVIVVADRYVAANMGHQGGKISDPAERTAFFAWLDALEYSKNGIPRPDMNIILHVPASVSISLIDSRGNAKDGHESDAEHLKRAEETFLEIARTFPGFTVVECAPGSQLLTIDEIHGRVWNLIKPLLSK